MTAKATAPEPVLRHHGNAYNIFILVLTIFSLAIMVLLILPVTSAERELLLLYDNVVAVIFLIDFAYNLGGAEPKRAYFIDRRGWLDLLGSIPSFGVFQIAGLLRLARLSRLTRITRLLRGQAGKDLVLDVLKNRGQYAAFITVLLAGMTLAIASILVLEFESRSPNGNIETGGEAIWWGVVTLTTVGYGDYYPVTTLGRITAVFVMFAGIGIIGALASILASVLVTSSTPDEPEPEDASATESPVDAPASATTTATIAQELAGLRAEMAGQRAEMAGQRAEIAALRASLGSEGS